VKAYFRARLGHPHCLYLDGQEAEAVERELARLDPEDFPALAKLERHLNRVTGAAE
jgi:uncharacterized protein YigE (DUF2233 family)